MYNMYVQLCDEIINPSSNCLEIMFVNEDETELIVNYIYQICFFYYFFIYVFHIIYLYTFRIFIIIIVYFINEF